jgi:dimethylamine monooxygenase subunit C
MTVLDHTSVPAWVHTPPAQVPPVPDAATALLLAGVGPDADGVLDDWQREAVVPVVRIHRADDADAAATALADAVGRAVVGTRVLLAGPPGACLRLRAAAFTAGVEDDEILVHPAGAGVLDLWCCHCDHVSRVEAAIGDELECRGCGRLLTVYHHVSRVSGRFLGWQVDAEERGWAERREAAS